MFFPERLNLHVHACRQIELHQRVHRLLRGLENIEQTLVRADLKLLPRFLIHVRRTQHAVLVFHRGQWNRPRNLCPGAARGFHNLARRLVQDAVVVSLQPDANSFFSNHVSLSLPLPLSAGGKNLRQEASRVDRVAADALVRESLSMLHARGRGRPRLHYCTISAIVPAPTVCPPSRMAKRKPFSIATGVINSITSETLSPGITISVPAGNSATPVTSVVRR